MSINLWVSIIALTNPPPGYEKVFKELANGRDPINDLFAKSKTRGALHVLRDVDSAPFGGVTNVERFELAVYPLGAGTKKRIIDVVTKGVDNSGLPKRLEYKSWERNIPRWQRDAAELEFVQDILFRDPPPDFEWVIKGTDLEKVQKVMLQTLGELPKNGQKQLHPMLEEARKSISNPFDDDALDAIIEKVKNLEVIRKEGY